MPIIAMHLQHRWQATACNLEVPPLESWWAADGWTHQHLNCISYSYLHATVLLQVRRLLGLGGAVCWSAQPSCTFQLFLPAIRKAPWPPLWDMAWWMVHWCFFHRRLVWASAPASSPFVHCCLGPVMWASHAGGYLWPLVFTRTLGQPELMPHLLWQCGLRASRAVLNTTPPRRIILPPF
jgi:hypothetical protein